MLKLTILTMMALGSAGAATDTAEWTAEQCMAYAVAHNHSVQTARLRLDNNEAAHLSAIGSFLPYVGASSGVQYNFGRAIDPETNTYTNVSTFYNYYSLSASIPVFDGLARVHQLKAARADLLAGKSSLQSQKDQTALATFQEYINVIYYQGTVKMAEEQLHESNLLLKQTQVMEEVGRKSAADVAQMEAQQAEADYELTRQQNMLASAWLALKQQMNLPESYELRIKNYELRVTNEEMEDANHGQDDTAAFATDEPLTSSLLETLYHQKQSALHSLRQTKAALWPTISLGAGVSTSYYKTLHTQAATSFAQQLQNNRGEYVAASISFPIFNRLQTITSIRRAKNNYLIAVEEYEAKQAELQKLVVEAANDVRGYRKATLQCQKKVEADSIAYTLTRRQWSEGLSSAIDLKTASATLLKSRASLLQNRLTTVLKRLYLRYYRGESLLMRSEE